MERVKLRRASDLNLQHIQSSLESLLIRYVGFAIGKHLLEERFAIGDDAVRGSFGLHLPHEGVAQMLFKVPLKLLLISFRERVFDGDGIFFSMIKTDYRA